MTEHTDAEIARAAKLLVQNPAFSYVLDYLRETALMEFEGATSEDDVARKNAWHLLDAVERLRSKMENEAKKAK